MCLGSVWRSNSRDLAVNQHLLVRLLKHQPKHLQLQMQKQSQELLDYSQSRTTAATKAGYIKVTFATTVVRFKPMALALFLLQALYRSELAVDSQALAVCNLARQALLEASNQAKSEPDNLAVQQLLEQNMECTQLQALNCQTALKVQALVSEEEVAVEAEVSGSPLSLQGLSSCRQHLL